MNDTSAKIGRSATVTTMNWCKANDYYRYSINGVEPERAGIGLRLVKVTVVFFSFVHQYNKLVLCTASSGADP